MRIRPFLPIATLVLLALTAQTARAQDNTLAFTYWLTIRPGSAPAFEAAWKEHLAFRRANGDTWTWAVLQQTFGDQMGTYVIRSAGHTWAEMDAFVAASASGRLDNHLTATVAPLVESVRSGVSSVDADMSVLPDPGTSINVLPVTNINVKPSGGVAFNAGLAAVKEAVMATGYPIRYVVLRRTFGGPSPAVAVVGQSPNFAGLASGEGLEAMLIQHFGPQRGAEIFGPFFESIESIETSILVARPDLSTPAAS